MKAKKYIYNYITTNLIDGKQYVGMHSTDNLDDGYLGSGIYFLKALKKYGKESFEKEIIFYAKDLDQASQMEEVFIKAYLTMSPDGYNLSPCGGIYKGSHMSEETKEKLRKINKGKVLSEETKRKISLGLKGRIVSEETKRKISESEKGKVLSEETLKKMSNSLKGIQAWNKDIPCRQETKDKLSKIMTGRVLTKKHKKNIKKGLAKYKLNKI